MNRETDVHDSDVVAIEEGNGSGPLSFRNFVYPRTAPWPPERPTPFDKKMAEAEAEVERWRAIVEKAREDRWRIREAAESHIAECEAKGRAPSRTRIQEWRTAYNDALRQYLAADERRRKAQARLNALGNMRERYLIQPESRFQHPRRPGEALTAAELEREREKEKR